MRMPATRSSPVLVLVGALFAPALALGQEAVRRVSLSEALEAFAANSLALKIARSETTRLAGEARQSRAYFNPAMSFERDALNRGERSAWEETMAVFQQIEWPGRTTARTRAAEHGVRAGAARLRADSIELAFEVREAYVQAWFAEEAEAVVRRTASAIQSVAQDAEVRLEAGDISAYEARRLRLARVEAELEMEDATLRSRAARRRLAALIEPGDPAGEIGPADGLDGVPPAVSREAAVAAVDGRPDVQAAASELDAARAGLDFARAHWVPAPSLGLGYRRHDDGFAGVSMAFELPLPLFDRGSGAREQAASESFAAAHRLELRTRMAGYDVARALDRYASNRTRFEAAAGLRADGEALLMSATAAYAEQETTLLELLDAASAFRGSQLSALSLASETWISFYDLLRAQGTAPEDER